MTVEVHVGHATDDENQTGCTVILFSEPVPCVVDVRGGAPGTRETDLLKPGRLVQRVDAVLFTGGSAFGLAATDGVMQYLHERGRGFETTAGPVPIVPAAVIFDLAVGNPQAPTSAMGYVAAERAVPIDKAEWGVVGAGRGATTSKVLGVSTPGGIGFANVPTTDGAVLAIAVANPLGVVVEDDVNVDDLQQRLLAGSGSIHPRAGENTTLVLVMVDAPLDHDSLTQIAVSAHDGMARAIVPCHTSFDGDLVFAVSLAAVDQLERHRGLALCVATEVAVSHAIRHAVRGIAQSGM